MNKVIALSALVLTIFGCQEEGNPLLIPPEIKYPPPPIKESTPPKEIEFIPTWEWVDDNRTEAEPFRIFTGIDRYFYPRVTINHYRDPETFTIPGSESLLEFDYQDSVNPELRNLETGKYIFPSKNRIFYDPQKIEILNDYEIAPPFFLFSDPRHCFLISDNFSINNEPTIIDLNSTEKNTRIHEIMDDIVKSGESVIVKRNASALVRLHYRYLGGGHTYIILYRCMEQKDELDADYIAIKVTSAKW